MSDITFKRTGTVNDNGSVMGELTVGEKTWPTVERGDGFTFVRMGQYNLKMDEKATGRRVPCLRFDHDGIRTHLIHDALNDNHKDLEGCIAPGLTKSDNGITGSPEAMNEVFVALKGFRQDAIVTITVDNNISGDETGDAWMRRRKAAGKY
jgi:hypothetical protein